MARQVAVFLPTSAPSRALLFTMQYGTPRALQSDGSHITISIGSTSCAITTSLASFSSTSLVTWLMPILTHTGFLEAAFLPAALASGLSWLSRRKSWPAWRLSKVCLNWLIAGGILMRWYKMRRERWMRMYFGHLTKRVRSPDGRMSPPILKVRGFFSIMLAGNSTLAAAFFAM